MGPSAELIGNVKGNFWMFKKVDNLEGKFKNIIIFLVVDFLRGLLFGIILWYFRTLSMYNAYCQLLKSCGLLIAVFGSSVINGVCYNLNINLNTRILLIILKIVCPKLYYRN